MLPICCTATGTRKAVPIVLPVISASLQAGRDAARSLAEDNWENEGGHFAGARALISPPAPPTNQVEGLGTQVRLMESTLSSDFANGRVGTRYNTYAHRSRVLRQQKAKLDAMRASVQAQGR